VKSLNWLILIIFGLALVLGLSVLGCAPAETPVDEEVEEEVEEEAEAPRETITLRYAFFAPAGTFPAVQMEEWARLVEERTDGWVQVETFPGGTLLGAMNMYEGVLEGVAEIGLTCPSYFPGSFPLIELVDFPLNFPSAEVASMVLWKLYEEFQPAELQDYKVITLFTTEPSFIQSKDRVASLEDLRGMELRAAGTGAPFLGALGATQVSMGQGEVGEALQTGVIDGYASSREVLYDFKYAEIVNYVTDYPIFQISFAALMDLEYWNTLPQEVKDVIDELGPEMAQWTGQYLDGHCIDAVEWAVAEEGLEVVTLTAEERARWDAVLQPLVDDAVDNLEAQGLPGLEFITRLYELRDQLSN
jgi:TRAP-type C4-dicarboxylate transport system substrate-binding protein